MLLLRCIVPLLLLFGFLKEGDRHETEFVFAVVAALWLCFGGDGRLVFRLVAFC